MTGSISDRQIAALQGIADGLQEVAAAVREAGRPGPCRCSTVPVFEREGREALVHRTDCPCAACDPGLILDGKPTGLPSRMSVCPDCGNKRCPKAANHAKWQCSGSNTVGQVGVQVEVDDHTPEPQHEHRWAEVSTYADSARGYVVQQCTVPGCGVKREERA